MHLSSARRARAFLPLPIPNDNGGTWFKAESDHSVAELERAFLTRQVGVALYERVGGLVPGYRRSLYIQIQLLSTVIAAVDMVSKEPVWKRVPSYPLGAAPRPDWTVQVCLDDLGIRLLHTVPLLEVATMYARRMA